MADAEGRGTCGRLRNALGPGRRGRRSDGHGAGARPLGLHSARPQRHVGRAAPCVPTPTRRRAYAALLEDDAFGAPCTGARRGAVRSTRSCSPAGTVPAACAPISRAPSYSRSPSTRSATASRSGRSATASGGGARRRAEDRPLGALRPAHDRADVGARAPGLGRGALDALLGLQLLPDLPRGAADSGGASCRCSRRSPAPGGRVGLPRRGQGHARLPAQDQRPRPRYADGRTPRLGGARRVLRLARAGPATSTPSPGPSPRSWPSSRREAEQPKGRDDTGRPSTSLSWSRAARARCRSADWKGASTPS